MPPAGSRQRAAGLIDQGVEAARAYDRPDLVERLGAARERLARRAVWVLVVGEFKQGKSSLVNALLGLPVCPVDDDVATSVPTVVRYAERPSARAIREPDAGLSGEPAAETPAGEPLATQPPTTEPRAESIDVDDLASFVSEAGNPDNRLGLRRVEVGLPHRLLAEGLVLVDTPGVGGLGSAHQTTTITALPAADAVLLVSDASSEYSEPELAFLQTARQLCPNVVCALTKTDLYPAWRKVADLDRGHLRRAGIDAEILPTSATLRTRALHDKDAALNEESGYERLRAYLSERVVGDAERLALRAAAHAVRTAAGQMERAFAAERSALADPQGSAELLTSLEQAKERAERLKGRAARWQQTLSDGVADLSSDVDYDLRARMRTLTREAEEAIEETDPGETWEQLEPWLYRRVHAEVAANYAMVTTRARELADEVAAHFGEEHEGAVAPLAVAAPDGMLERLEVRDEVGAERSSKSDRGLNVLRSSYGGVFMFGMLGRVVGLGLFNPFSIAMGVLLGRKALKDEREKELQRRRQEATQAVRKYVDEVSFEVGKDSRDTLRRVQRSLRDDYTAQAEELQRSVGHSLAAAEQAVKVDRAERQRRLADVDAELGRLRRLREQADALAPERAAAAVPAAESPAPAAPGPDEARR